MPISRKRVAPISCSSRSRPAAKILARQLRRRGQRARPRADLEIGAFELERHRRAGKRIGFQPKRHPLGQFPKMLLKRAEFADVAVKGGFGGNALGFAFGADGTGIDAAGKPPQPRAFLAVAAHQFLLVGALEIGDQPIAVIGKLCRAHRADAVDEADRFWRQKCRGLILHRARQSRAACPCRRRSWRGTCWPTGRSRP